MKTRKRLVALAMALVLIATALVLPAAAAVRDDNVVSPCYAVCPRCGSNMVEKTTWSGVWVTTEEVDCIHHVYGTDVHQTQSGVKTYVCSKCTFGRSTSVSRSQTVCHGYDTP